VSRIFWMVTNWGKNFTICQVFFVSSLWNLSYSNMNFLNRQNLQSSISFLSSSPFITEFSILIRNSNGLMVLSSRFKKAILYLWWSIKKTLSFFMLNCVSNNEKLNTSVSVWTLFWISLSWIFQWMIFLFFLTNRSS
jgi:hypothetical protein